MTANASAEALGQDHGIQVDWFQPFHPPRWLQDGHAQTLAGNYWRRVPFAIESASVAVVVDPADNSRVLCHCHWQPENVRSSRLTLLLVHGLEGSSDSRYIQGLTALAWQAGCNVVRMNMRNCGGTETWTPTLYHSGLSGDIDAVLRYFSGRFGLRRIAAVGYSMGGNLVLKHAGELSRDAPHWLRAIVGVCPAADLAPTADALHEPANRVYEWHFRRNLMRRFRRKAKLFPTIYRTREVGPIRTLREFDDKITARYSGFSGAADYYYRASAARVVSRIAVPTLILHALDDPFIRLTAATRATLLANPAVYLAETAHGGHCAFLADIPPGSPTPRHWAESTIVRYLLTTVGHADAG